MRIDIWSDVICPFCWIGKRHLEQALEEFRTDHPDFDVEVMWRAFQLDPNAPTTAVETTPEMLARKYSMPLEAAEEAQEEMARKFASVGLEFNWREAKPCNTFDAHRLAMMAADRGHDDAIDEALKKAHFTDGLEISDHGVLRGVGESIGLPGEEVAAMLASDDFALEVRHDITMAEGLGISGVPFFVFDGKFAVNGAQPVDVFRQALSTAWEEANKGLTTINATAATGSTGPTGADGTAADSAASDASGADAGESDSAATDDAADGPDCSDGSCSV
ncbi:DsbA family oxidoreductase [uncultured Corynebacterium sp.]|uniref:DsbA family oxidoreductase n=1 Tax=uncultured Corynebacterium sp. TaxID=159447 RepID=UPI0026010AED|nr:DsbA family oxidoreductase [uncultured Corynebacterium sp.]